MSDLLATYLHDHLAGAVHAVEPLEACRSGTQTTLEALSPPDC
jgi:hypothetical protein